MNGLHTLSGTGALVRLILRRDRVSLLLWIVGFALLVVGVAASIPGTYHTALARQAVASETSSNPTELILLGPVFNSSIGGLLAWRVRGWAAIGIGLAGMLTVIRHTRTEEETGRRELLGSTVVGRNAPLSAALLVTLSGCLLLALLVFGGLVALGLPPGGSLALGLSIAADGWIFATLAALFAQLTRGAGAARSWVGALLAAFYLLRAVGDVGGPAWMLWLSPLGWVEEVRPFAQESWWPFALIVVLTLGMVGIAYSLAQRRDIGAGLLPERLGPATASPALRSPLALAWRLQRGPLLAWIIGAIGFGAALGGVAQSASAQINASVQLRAVLASMGSTARPVDDFFAVLIYLMVQVITGYALATLLRLRAEETDQRVDPLLSLPVSRLRWAGGYLLIALLGSALILLVLGLCIGGVYGLGTGNMGETIGRLLAAVLVRLPAIWVLTGLAAALYGLWPRLASIVSWSVLGLLLLLEFGVELQVLSPTVLKISPFAASPNLLVAGWTPWPLLWLSGIALFLICLGGLALHRRDIA